MDRAQKEAAVAEIAASLGDAESILAVDYRGISVPQAAELRTKLREADARFKIVKNRLAKLAVEQAGTDELTPLLEGPTALTFVRGDVVTAAKAINSFTREHGVLIFKGGLMGGQPLDEDRFKTLARLPALEVMHGQLVGMTAAPLTGLVRGLGAMIGGLAIALGQIAEQGLVSGEAPATEEEEAPVEEEAPETAQEEPEASAEEPVPQPSEDPAAPGREAEEAAGSDVAGGPSSDEAAPAAAGGSDVGPEAEEETETNEENTEEA